ncbi:MAG: DUF1178 family protein [Pseudomonadota bacterium]
MIRYALACQSCDHEFEAWFASSSAYDDQAARGLVSCPDCGGTEVGKQIMAPSVAGTRKTSPEEAFKAFAAKARKHVADTHDYVGEGFADEARAMHYGETETRPIWGKSSVQDAKALADEGVPALPLPEQFAPPEPKPEKDDLN